MKVKSATISRFTRSAKKQPARKVTKRTEKEQAKPKQVRRTQQRKVKLKIAL